MVFFQEEWNDRTKLDHYLAQIAAEIRQIREGFSKEPRLIETAELLIDFVQEGEETETTRHEDNGEPAERYTRARRKKRKTIDLDNPEPLDAEWQRVNDEAKAIWAQRLGRSPRG